ncbi:MAG: hypothetical protein SWK76_00200 [Actinomycetota bacterium]|nr:hypothetical protein [Actinomycetota bacterium]
MEPITVSFESLHELTVSNLRISIKLFQDLRDKYAAGGEECLADIYATVLQALIIERKRRDSQLEAMEPYLLLEENDIDDDPTAWTRPEDFGEYNGAINIPWPEDFEK